PARRGAAVMRLLPPSSSASLFCLRYFAFVSGILLCSAATAQPQNPVAVENTRPGTTELGFINSTTPEGQLRGYASATSVNRGESITFYINTQTAPGYVLQIYRMGCYPDATGKCLGARAMLKDTPVLPAMHQPACPPAATTYLIDCGSGGNPWQPSYTLTIPLTGSATDPTDLSYWCTGVYLAKLTESGPPFRQS